MTNFIEKLHRTWIESLIRHDFTECASLIVDARLELDEQQNRFGDTIEGLCVYLTFDNYERVKENEKIRTLLSENFNFIAKGHPWHDMSNFPIEYRVELMEVDENWQKIIKYLITNSKELNQGLVTEKCFSRKEKNPIIYNEMKFASQTEVRIAQELENTKVLFFPLPLAVRAETGKIYEDHREVDFLVCHEGTWGILEVSHHPNRYEKDKEKDAWFKQSGILCIEHYSAEKCYNSSKKVVHEFLSILSKFKR
ncbi:hypothetical protein [Chroococcus sp. FPU101]|uniref:hypothetical protein n=1 Tax=Chroococcus sp. FPU101 TaxID=1974212 RepID=UPI001A8D43EB|nr:hypothetical protein [Chroococcus sp. FPU101]GFE72270.1 hypothetical protein CFPU101_48800 [Chroococcus sp. FPU101]